MAEATPLEALEIRVADLTPSKLNPRKRIDQAALDELAESVTAHGILQPLLVRPGKAKAIAYEIICGERRWRAAKKAGVGSVPATVRTLDDAQALEIMLIENGRREDLDPIEEAETYDALREKYGYTIEQIAARVGKSKTAVFQRLKLTALVGPVREALADGSIEVSVAELIARSVHPSRQEEALDMVGPTAFEPAASYRDAKREIEDEFMLRLVDAPWSLDDADLVPDAGSCKACPKRTGNQRDLFPDVKATDVCLDSACFDGKRKALRQRRVDQAREQGEAVLEGDAAKKVLGRGEVKSSSGYVDVSMPVPGSSPKGRKPKTLLAVIGKKDLPPVTTVVDPDSDTTVRVISREDAVAALKPKKLKLTAPSTSTRSHLSPREQAIADKQRQREAESRRKLKLRLAGFDRAIETAVANLEKRTTTGKRCTVDSGLLQLLAIEVLDSVWSDAAKATRARRGVEKPKGSYHGEQAALIPLSQRSPGAALGIILEVMLQRKRPRYYDQGPKSSRDKVRALLAAAGVDYAAIERETKRYAAALDKAAAKKRAAKKAPTKKRTAKKAPAKKTARGRSTAKGGRSKASAKKAARKTPRRK